MLLAILYTLLIYKLLLFIFGVFKALIFKFLTASTKIGVLSHTGFTPRALSSLSHLFSQWITKQLLNKRLLSFLFIHTKTLIYHTHTGQYLIYKTLLITLIYMQFSWSEYHTPLTHGAMHVQTP